VGGEGGGGGGGGGGVGALLNDADRSPTDRNLPPPAATMTTAEVYSNLFSEIYIYTVYSFHFIMQGSCLFQLVTSFKLSVLFIKFQSKRHFRQL